MRSANARSVGSGARILLVASAVAGCSRPENAQYILHIDTDAPLAVEANGVLGPDDPVPLFDRLWVNTTSGCAADCSRTFAVDRAMFRDAEPTFGVYSTQAIGGTYVFLAIYRDAGLDSTGTILQDASIGGYALLPPLKPQAAPVDLYVQLKVEDIGTYDYAKSATKTLAVATEPWPKLETWSGSRRVDCEGSPGPGEVCVPGGAFWLGNMGDIETQYQRLGVVSPFYMDSTETSVGDFRASGIAKVDAATSKLVDPVDTRSDTVFCDYTAHSVSPEAEQLPVNCVSWNQARAYCQKEGKDLPSWMQFEYVQGGLVSDLYPWGRDEPTCKDAVFARSSINNTSGTFSFDCTEPDTPAGPALPKSGLRDRVDLPTGTLYDLAGNVSEFALDYAVSAQYCTSDDLLKDFVCTDASKSTSGYRTMKGGRWFAQAFVLRAAFFGATTPTETDADGAGFRCVRPSTAKTQ